ncbi:hypothetical protein F4805DRAFT_473949 [Annulohypoxylon moriforme]|nr:hypothetical protein F4805DRAFT_473949 [Annulohypoxylon moriforme]
MDSSELPTLVSLLTGKLAKGLLRRIDIYHPGYPDLDPLLSLQAADDGLFYPLLYYACCVVACNVWTENEGRHRQDEPFISESPNPDMPPVTIPDDDILRGNKYYFHVPGHPNNRYPFYPNFEHWSFPESIPNRFSTVNLSGANEADRTEKTEQSTQSLASLPAVKLHNESCRFSGTWCGLELCHIVPKSDSNRKWFKRNHMRDYATSDGHLRNDPLYSYCNLLPLRKDIHWFFDHSNLVFFPRKDPNPNVDKQPRFRSHTLLAPGKSNNGDLELITRYHNKPLFSLQGLSREYFFARFAWSLFVRPIMLILKDPDVDEDVFLSVLEFQDGGSSKRVLKEFNGDYPRPRSGNNTRGMAGTKRTYSEAQDNDELADGYDSDVLSQSTSHSAYYDDYFDNIHSQYDSDSSDTSDYGSISTQPRKRPRSLPKASIDDEERKSGGHDDTPTTVDSSNERANIPYVARVERRMPDSYVNSVNTGRKIRMPSIKKVGKQAWKKATKKLFMA